MDNKRNPFRPASRAAALEPRMLFDGAAVAAAFDHIDAAPDPAAAERATPAVDATPSQPSTGQAGTLLVVDARVADHQSLIAGLPGHVTVRVIGLDESGIDAIGAALAGGQPLEAIHILSHGGSGSLTLGSDTIDAASLAAQGSRLQTWAAYLTADADILLYGCDVGAGEAGQALLTQLASLTGADIAASTGATGAASHGGDWALETATGAIEAPAVLQAAAMAEYGQLLAATGITDAQAAGTRVTAEDTPLAITGLSVAGGAADTITLSIATTGGSASLGSTTGLVVTGNGSDSIALTGTIADVNAALATLSYTPTADQNSSTSGFSPALTLNVTLGGSGSLTVSNISVTAVNDAPQLGTGIPLSVAEGGQAALGLAQLAGSAAALDPDIATGQQVLAQQMVTITSLPAHGTLTFNGGTVAAGQVIPVTALGSLVYTHNGADLASPGSDSFGITVSDGGGGVTAGTVAIALAPVNAAPTISGSPTLVEGQVKPVAPVIDLGDAGDSLATSTIVIDNVVTGGQGTLFLDANGNNVVDAGEEITGSRALTPTEAANLSAWLKFAHNGSEPNAPGATAPSYRITVTDAGGGEGAPAAKTTAATIGIGVEPNNDDPTLSNAHATPGTALGVSEGTVTTITGAMLAIADADRNPANVNQTTPANQLVYTIGTRPAQGEIQLYIGSGMGPDGDGWIVLGDGGRFTQADVDAGNVRYYQTTDVASDTTDGFTFTVRDSAFGYDVWTDPANPAGGREGGLRDTPTGPIALQNFHFSVQADADPHENPYTGDPRPATPGYGGSDMAYDFVSNVASPGNAAAGATWNEAIGGAYPITDAMLSYTVTRTDTRGTPGDTSDDVSVTVPPEETVYTLTAQPGNGTLQRQVGMAWEDIPTNGQFTQADIDAGRIRFVHDGSENHTSTFGFTVSDGTPNHENGSFAIDVVPTNDRPVAAGGSAQVTEGNGNAVRLGGSVVGMSDVDLSQDAGKQTGEGAADFLWFKVTALPPEGALERWNGAAWVAVDATTWLPRSLLGATADGGTSGLRYVHDGSEPLTYPGGPYVSFDYVVRDDLADPGNAWATDASTPPDTSGATAANQSDAATATIHIIPVNDAPQVADTPGAPDPTIDATIGGGGATTGANEILADVPEGATVLITSAHLTAVDPDSTTVQRQFRITTAPTLGTLLLNGTALGVGSTFTQDDIDNNRVSYRHNGSEVGAPTAGFGAQYHDKFHFVVNDGVLEDIGAGADRNVFLITLAPANDKPTVTAPGGPITIDSTTAANNPVAGFSVDDPDLAVVDPSYETDFVQVTVRVLDSSGNPTADHATGFAGGGVQIGHATPSDTGGLWAVTRDGNDDLLQIQGTRAQVNAALAGLTVTFANDADARYRLQVIVDDRMRDGSGALQTGGSDANGGELNQPATPGGAPTAVPGTEYDWLSQATLAATDPNISFASVELRASHTNDPATFTGPATVAVDEDVRSPVRGFTVADPESAAFDTPVTVTVSVPTGQGTLGIGAAGAATSLTPAGGQAVTISGDNTRSITLTGRAQDIQALLNGRNAADTADDANGGLFYTSASNVNHDVNGNGAGDGDVTLTLAFNDSGSAIGGDTGSGSQPNNPANVTTGLAIAAVNDAPGVSAGTGAIAVASSAATAVPGFAVNDVDADNGYADGETDGILQVTVRLLDGAGAPVAAGVYATLGVQFGTTASGHGATVDATLDGDAGALELRGTRDQINAYLAGLQVTFANLGSANVDSTYRVEVVADDRLRDGTTGTLLGGANGGASNQQAGLPAVPATDSFDPYATTVAGYGVYNVARNTRDLFISSINDPGHITANDVTVDEGSATLVLDASNANITLEDSDDNGASTMEVTVTVGAGTITAVGGTGGSVSGLGTDTVTITGATEAQINAYLKALTITLPDVDGAGAATAADWNGSFDVTVVYNDKGNTGTRPGTLADDTDDARTGNGDFSYADGASNHLVTTRIITVTVDGVNDAPIRTSATVTLPAGTEDTDGGSGDTVQNLFGGAFSDARDAIGDGTNGSTADSFAGIAITTNTSLPEQGVWQYSTDGGSNWTNVPAVTTATALLLDPTAKLRFDPADDFHGTPGGLTARLVDNSSGAVTSGTTANVTASGGTTQYSDASNAVTLNTTVANVNDRPTATPGSLAAVEDVTSGAGTPVSSLATTLGYSDATDDQTAITGGGDADTAFGGIAIVGNASDPDTQGTWQYSTNGGTDWTDVPTTGLGSGSALVLPTDALLRFNPSAANYNGTPGSLTVHVADSVQAFDGSASLALGTTSTWSDAVTLGAVVAPRNDAPGFTHAPTNPTVTENATTGSGTSIDPVKLLGSGTVSDIDLGTTAGLDASVFGAGSITVTLTDGIAGDALQLDGLAAGAGGIVSISGGTGSTPLVITLAADATVAQVEAILAAIEYTNTSDDPTHGLSGTPQTTRSYTIVLSDGNNDQAGGDAGGPGPLTATASGTITITPANDPPTATDNTNSVTEDSGVPATGNVITNDDGDGLDSDPDTPAGDLTVTRIQAADAATPTTVTEEGISVPGKYGTLTIHPDGSYSYALDESNPVVNALRAGEQLTDEVFTYTLSDSSATDTATLTITIDGYTDGGPAIVPVDGNDDGDPVEGHATVYERGLASVSDTRETAAGDITVTTPEGLASVTIGGTTFTLAELLAFTPGAPSAAIDTGEGTLRVTGLTVVSGSDAAPTASVLHYTYTLKAPLENLGAQADSRTDDIALRVDDVNGDFNPGTLTVLIIDDVPAAQPDTGSITKGTASIGGNVVTAGSGMDQVGADGPASPGPVTGLDGGTVGSPLAGAHGSLTLQADGSYTYALDHADPDVAALGYGQALTDVFTYTITDADGDTSSTTLTITIHGNHLPQAANDSFSTPEDTPLHGSLTGNDTPSADGGNVWAKGSDPAHGTVVVNPDGTFTYTPHADYHGPDSFTYTLTDVNGDRVTATVNLTVQPVDDVPVAVDDRYTLDEDTPLTGSLTGNDTPSGDGGNVWTKASDPAHGTVVVNPDGSFTYTPHADYHGPDSFTYTITDADGDTSTATVTLTVLPVDDVPVAVDDRYTLDEDTLLTGSLTGNDTPSGDGSNVWTKASDPAHGTVVVNPDGSFTYTPHPDYHGPDSFTYTITDADGDTSTATAIITVRPVNDVPVAVDDRAATPQDQPVSGHLQGNDTPSPDGGNVWTQTTDPSSGTVVVHPDGTYTYTPNPGFVGEDRFTYTITDADGDTSTATVTITVVPPTDPDDVPVAVPDHATTPRDEPVSGNLAGNDTPSNDGGNVWTQTTDPAHGTVVVHPDGTYTYTPDPGFVGEDSFTYTITDADGDTSTATVTITVEPPPGPDDVPVAVPDWAVTPPGQPVSGDLAGNDTPSADGGNVWTVADGPSHGSVVVRPDGTYTYTPHPGYVGEDRFTYTVTDADGDASTATVTIVVDTPRVPVDDARAPTPVDGPYFGVPLADGAWRVGIPFEPVDYVNREVRSQQDRREAGDVRAYSHPAAADVGELDRSSRTPGLGFDPAVFVQHAVRNSQGLARHLDLVVEGRLSRLSLGSDHLIPTPELGQPDAARLVPPGGEAPAQDGSGQEGRPPAERASGNAGPATGDPAAAGLPPGVAEPPAAAPSFSQQLRGGAHRLPMAASPAPRVFHRS